MFTQTRFSALTSIFLILITGTPFAATTEPDALIGQDYAYARKILIKDHWIPFHHSASKTMEYYKKIYQKYPEIDSCAIDKPVCSFSFKKARKCIRIITWGEEMKSFRVNAVIHECLDDTKH